MAILVWSLTRYANGFRVACFITRCSLRRESFNEFCCIARKLIILLHEFFQLAYNLAFFIAQI